MTSDEDDSIEASGTAEATHSSAEAADLPAADLPAADLPAVDVPAEPNDSSEAESEDLLAQLSTAMHVAAEAEHQRIADGLDRQRATQLETIKARASGEAETLKQTSERDIREIDAWATNAADTITAERARRIDSRRAGLQAALRRHDVIVERELMAVEVTIEEHMAELDAFFKRLASESDPAAIAQFASSLPTLPSLTESAEAARRHAAAEFAPIDEPSVISASDGEFGAIGIEVSPSRLMAVMDPDAGQGTASDGARPWPEPRVIAVPAGVGASSTVVGTDARPLLRTVPATRPFDRLRGGNRKPSDDPDRET